MVGFGSEDGAFRAAAKRMCPPVDIPDSDAALLAECEVESFRAGGPGGQHHNKTDSAVRLRHAPTGLTVTCRAQRSQYLNKMDALRRLRLKLVKMNEPPPPPRRATRPSRGAVERRLAAKKGRAVVKRLRRPPAGDD
ncbi:MAG: peptide chain release factor-like protein [Actinobacteria bacterium]|nr:peptide chain release factor-like protein [Actinomycetota bacterium]